MNIHRLPFFLRLMLAMLLAFVSMFPIVVLGVLCYIPAYLLHKLMGLIEETVLAHLELAAWLLGKGKQ